MMFNRPHFKEYVMARLVTIAILLFIVFSIFLILITPDTQDEITPIFLIALAFSIFIFFIYRGAGHMQKELTTINKYLANLEEIDQIDYEAHFFTQEFEEINQNLIGALKKAKKREDIKQRYNAKLKLKNRQRADMISAIAHEFRNPIASIMGYSQTLQDDPDIPKLLQEKFLGKIYNNGNKIEALLSRLILWNKFESGEATLHKSSFDIYTLTQEIKLALEEQYKNREILIKGESHVVEADRTLMEVVLKNLIENALKYSKDEVLVEIEGSRISVSDKGVGISDKDIDKVTKKFYRSGTHNWDNSMGLGLSIVKTILALHQSKLDIKSKENEGSTFSFSF
ncbi:sensor histidine kinase [Sulfurovum sp. CS9]|uniref:sensor histidine kinase n=1 Tax=Sulfurovum sp. CS9 TaxID=3391146 RepID=UPI0039E80D2D